MTYIILTQNNNGTFTKWAEIEKTNLVFLKQVIDFFMKSTTPGDFLIYDTEKNEVHRLIDCKIMEV